jgi:hypothetical protein
MAEAWLDRVLTARHGAKRPNPSASFVERLAPAMLSLSAMNAHFRAGQAGRPPAVQEEQRRLFAFIEARCSDERYREIQEVFLDYRALYILARATDKDELVGPEKYLYAPFYAVSKLGAATRLGLHERPPMRVLDLGAGPAHFGLVCASFGHTYHGLDIPLRPSSPFHDRDLYGELFAAFGLERMLQRITAFTPLVVTHRFDMVSCLMGLFCTNRVDGKSVSWTWPEWQFFLRDLIDNVLEPRFEVFLNLNRQYFPGEIQHELRTRGATVDPERSTFRFTDAQADAIRR